ncbi:sulfite exporter TauE/SafE family protein [Candidatus Magnetaquicoccus inordinatus]|uniref:sulfite exporter TauE/SafE family protein n=1 Tax=Candidatus Magnetaquicoccus inordinatus TaxID=2496818 RepID=UPI00102C1DCD|nr:sulfite exporter TauE/SafE family protein [Candidatus Magnetaquicoccus inordinatus]
MTIFTLQFFGYLASGLLAGLLAGLFGVGGGIIIVPALLYLFHMDGINPVISMQLAAGTSLATIIFTSLSATWNHHRRHSVHWPMVHRYSPGMIIGVWLGAQLAALLESDDLVILFAFFEIAVGLRMLSHSPKETTAAAEDASAQPTTLQGFVQVSGIATIIGILSTLFGIGGGTMLVPALTLLSGLTIHQAIGTSSAIGAILSLVGTTGMIQSGWENSALPPDTLGFVVPLAALGVILGTLITTPLGVKLAHLTEPQQLKKGFGILLLLVGIRLLW